MNELEQLKIALYKQSQRNAQLTVDLDLAFAEIEMLNRQIKSMQKESQDAKKSKAE